MTRFHPPSYIMITDLGNNFQICDHPLPSEHSTRELYIDLFDKGGIYDDQNKGPLTYEKAIRQNIRHQKLPLEKYLT